MEFNRLKECLHLLAEEKYDEIGDDFDEVVDIISKNPAYLKMYAEYKLMDNALKKFSTEVFKEINEEVDQLIEVKAQKKEGRVPFKLFCNGQEVLANNEKGWLCIELFSNKDEAIKTLNIIDHKKTIIFEHSFNTSDHYMQRRAADSGTEFEDKEITIKTGTVNNIRFRVAFNPKIGKSVLYINSEDFV